MVDDWGKNCMQKLRWKVLCHGLDGNHITSPKNNPKKSGKYLCTCITRYNGFEYRYLRVMEFDVEHQHWHDEGNKSAISSVILAWADVDMYMGDDFDYEHGIYWKSKVFM